MKVTADAPWNKLTHGKLAATGRDRPQVSPELACASSADLEAKFKALQSSHEAVSSELEKASTLRRD